MLSLFEEMELEAAIEAERVERERAAQMELARLPKVCDHCGETSPNEYLWSTNHGTPNYWDLPGICIRHHSMWNQAQWPWGHEARQWLTERGFALPEVREEGPRGS